MYREKQWWNFIVYHRKISSGSSKCAGCFKDDAPQSWANAAQLNKIELNEAAITAPLLS